MHFGSHIKHAEHVLCLHCCVILACQRNGNEILWHDICACFRRHCSVLCGSVMWLDLKWHCLLHEMVFHFFLGKQLFLRFWTWMGTVRILRRLGAGFWFSHFAETESGFWGLFRCFMLFPVLCLGTDTGVVQTKLLSSWCMVRPTSTSLLVNSLELPFWTCRNLLCMSLTLFYLLFFFFWKLFLIETCWSCKFSTTNPSLFWLAQEIPGARWQLYSSSSFLFFSECAVDLNPFHGYSSNIPVFPHLLSVFSLSLHFRQLHSLLGNCILKTHSSSNKAISCLFKLC